MGGLIILAAGMAALLFVAGSEPFKVVAGKLYRFTAAASPAPPPAVDSNVFQNLSQAGATNISVARVDNTLRVSYTAKATATQEMKPIVTIGGLRFELESVKEA